MHNRISIITVFGGSELIGELGDEPTASGFLKFWHPCLLRVNPPNSMSLVDIIRNSPVLTGSYVLLNMASVLWMAEPSDKIKSAYQAQRSGLLVPESMPPNVAGVILIQ